jgi:hypothetical protein
VAQSCNTPRGSHCSKADRPVCSGSCQRTPPGIACVAGQPTERRLRE